MLSRQFGNLVVIQQVVLFAHTVLYGVEPFAGLVRLGPVGQVTPGIKAHTQNGVAGLQQRGKDTLVCLAARVRLDVGECAVEQRTGAFDGKVLGHVDMLASAIIATARITFGVFVGHDAALRLKHRSRDDVLAGDQFDLVALAAQFGINRSGEGRVGISKRFGEEIGHQGILIGAGFACCLSETRAEVKAVNRQVARYVRQHWWRAE